MNPTRHLLTGKWTLASRQEQVNVLIPIARIEGFKGDDAPRAFSNLPKKAEAERTARDLQAHWRARGFPLALFWTECVDAVDEHKKHVVVFEIKSNLKNGVPPLACVWR